LTVAPVVALVAACCIAPGRASAVSHGLLAHGSIVGDPHEDAGSVVDAGVVYLFPPKNDVERDRTSVGSLAITEATLHVTPQPGDMFGASVLQADTNGDGMNDLIIGAPGRNRGSGAVFVVRSNGAGTAYDFAHPIVIEQGFDGIAGSSEAGDHFGATLLLGATVTTAWFAIGVPDEDVGSVVDAGDVVVMPLDLSSSSVTVYPGHGAPDAPQAGDHFGAAMSQIDFALAVGLPGHDQGSAKGAGQVDVLAPGGTNGFPGEGMNSTVVQGTAGVPDHPSAGNAFGAALAQPSAGNLAVGAPSEEVAGAVSAGTVTVVPFGAGGFSEFTPGVAGIPGRLQAYEHFGAALFAPGDLSFLAGAPGANVGSAKASGEVLSFALNNGTESYDAADTTMFDESALHQSVGAGDGFGGVLGAGDKLAFGIPHKQIGSVTDAGEVAFADLYAPGQSMIVQRFVQGRDGVPGSAEHGDEMGGALPAN
jgi:hypothetical protein